MKTIEGAEPTARKHSPRKSKKWWIISVAVLVLLAAGTGIGLRFYPAWNQKRLIARAEKFAQAKDYNSAVLTLQRVLQLNEKSVPATGLMAEIADTAKSPQALIWSQRLVEVQPERLSNHLDLVERALKAGKPEIAQATLEKAASIGSGHARYHFLRGQLAIRTNEPSKATADLDLAHKLEPQNQTYRFDQAAHTLIYGDRTEWEVNRKTIEEFLLHQGFFSQASRALVVDALRARDADGAVSLADGLRNRPDATFHDRLFYVALLGNLRRPAYTSALTEIQAEAATDAQKLYSLVTWLNANRGALLAIEWSKRLPSEILSTMPVPIALAQSYAVLGDWAGLKPLAKTSGDPRLEVGTPSEGGQATPDEPQAPADWKAYEFMRHALLSRALQEQDNLPESKIQWSAAVKAAGTRIESLSILAKAAIQWNRETDATELLWAVARGSKDSRWALDILYRRYAASGSTRNLHQVVSRIHEIDPDERWATNNLVNLSFLLGLNVDQGIKMADDLFAQNPQDPAIASTYAYALHLRGRTPEALEIMKSLGEDRLHEPEYAAYYGVLLAASGAGERAQEFLTIGSKAPLLPEERKLLEDAAAKAKRVN